jgi:ribosomal-protein-alanine N-acetyltransferase
MVELRTPRLVLRRWQDEDVSAFADMSADPVAMRYLRALPDRAAAEAWAAQARMHWEEHGFGQWVVEIPQVAAFIGVVGLSVVPYRAHFAPAVEVAWRLAQAEWGNGYATEAARAALDHGFAPLGFHEIVAVTIPANRPSRAVMERLGMHREPVDDFDHPRVPEGPLKRHVLYRLRRPEAGGD